MTLFGDHSFPEKSEAIRLRKELECLRSTLEDTQKQLVDAEKHHHELDISKLELEKVSSLQLADLTNRIGITSPLNFRTTVHINYAVTVSHGLR